MLQSRRPVIAVLASRTGAGKSTIARYVMRALKAAGAKPVAIRHPMPYGRLSMAVERYATPRDVVEGEISVEAMEEYQQHVADGSVVYAGVDYARILAAAEQEGDVIVWDGGNNDTSFLWPDVTVTVLDPTRPLDGARFFPGEVNIRAADILVVNKVNVASANDVEACIADAALLSQSAAMIRMESVEAVDRPELVRNRRVLAIDDGPSLTHGGMSEGVAARAARMLGAELIDPRGHAIGSIARAFERYAHIGPVLPALGYDQAQLDDLARTIEGVACDTVLLGTPAPLDRLISIRRPVARASFHARDRGTASLAKAIRDKLSQRRSNETGCGREARPSP